MRKRTRISKKQLRELRALAAMRDDRIDLSDAPEVRDWRGAVVGRFYRPIKKSLTIRLDADVLAWFRSGGDGYQTRINALLRAAMAEKSRKRRRVKRKARGTLFAKTKFVRSEKRVN
jgi:uncharacterized protein (DUF4415 family)